MDDGTDPERGDAFGAALRAYYEEGREDAAEIIERDDGWIGPNEVAGYFSDSGDWPAIVRDALDRVEGRVLDVGCGAGRHARYLQERGHDVTGIDISPAAIDIARDRGVEDVRRVDVREVADAVDPDTFDSVVMLGNNFGLVGTAETAPERLRALATVTTDDATLLAGTRDPTATDDEAHLAYHERNRERDRLPGALRIRVRYGRLASEWHDYLMAAPDTLDDLASETPWRLDEVFTPKDRLTRSGGDYVGVLTK